MDHQITDFRHSLTISVLVVEKDDVLDIAVGLLGDGAEVGGLAGLVDLGQVRRENVLKVHNFRICHSVLKNLGQVKKT